MLVNKKLDINKAELEKRFADCGDIVAQSFTAGGRRFYITYFDDLVNRAMLENHVIRALTVDSHINGADMSDAEEFLRRSLSTADYKTTADLETAIDEMLSGNTLLLLQGYDKAVTVSSKNVPTRGVNPPETEVSVQGPRDAFCESIRTNTVLIRRRIRDTALKCRQLKLGRRTKTDAALMYIEGMADEKTVKEAERRLKAINADAILDSGYIEQYIQDNKHSPFPQVQLTERPDKAAAGLLEGRVAIVADNTPFVILIPAVLASFYQASEDYYQRWEIASFVRVIRYVSGFFAFTLPGLYVAVMLYDPELLPLDLMLHLAGARIGVPVSVLTEVVVMELAFEALREAGIRLPAAVGGTLGIVGGIIIGQSAVEAGLVSPMAVIVVALTGICSFTVPAQPLVSAYRMIKYFVIAASAMFGIYGFVIAVLCVMAHTAALESFGMPYIYPFGKRYPNIKNTLKDSIIRLPLSEQEKNEPIFSGDE